MYSLGQIKKGLSNPRLVVKEINRKREDISSRYGRYKNSKHGIQFLAEDWDNLILLDACRFDLFKQVNTIDGSLTHAISNASTSDEFFEKNIEGKEHGDLVYYSANPHIDNIDASFYDLYRLWELDWDEKTGTVLPGDAIDRVIDTVDQYDDKRIILHMMQPHRPFLGERAEDFEQPGFSRGGVNIPEGASPEIPFWWDRMEEGRLTKDDVWPMYKENLEIAMPHVQRLVDYLPGKSVVSADHGNVFGEDGMYGHPGNTHHKKLVTVPWLEIEKSRKNIKQEEATVSSKRQHFDEAGERLEALGYVQTVVLS